MMSQQSHHLHHHPFNDFSTMAGNPPASIVFESNIHDPFGMDQTSNPNRRGFGSESAAVSVAAPGPWSAGSSSITGAQSLSLTLQTNCPVPHSFHLPPPQPFLIKSSKYLLPAQELLNEFCSLGGGNCIQRKNGKPQDEFNPSWSHHTLFSMEPSELHKRKTKLLSMLEEVDKRYGKYCEKMKAVVSTFEGIAGEGAAKSYSILASKAMSRHFRCLRDGIIEEVRATRRAMGETDAAATPGLTRGETPRLRLLDQRLRQQKAVHHAGLAESHPWRPQRGLPERSVSVLRAWLFEHFLHPYPSDVDKHILARQTGLSRSQVSNWFINARVRLWKPMVEEMYKEEMQEEEMKDEEMSYNESFLNSNPNPNPASRSNGDDQKPEPQLLQIEEPNSLSSIITGMNNENARQHSQIINPNPNFDVLNVDFASYRGHELTLGLQQREAALLFSRGPLGDDGEAVRFSMLEEEEHNIPYRNFMEAQLLHDLAD
ncbi:hypothetical protein HPP92_008926 [Vanilla planifolia]|uniref:Homeobox domain-containing protein n=1 Tax=Vanilla planifolia TaxID=51239 RepID=A0A835REP8_VANPL|nr:hypothetical protein HPP92_008926 [Vanilla planifolia]